MEQDTLPGVTPLLANMKARCSDCSSEELDAGMCDGVVWLTASALHFLRLWFHVVLPTFSRTSIRELCSLFKTGTKMTLHNQRFWNHDENHPTFVPCKDWKLILKSFGNPIKPLSQQSKNLDLSMVTPPSLGQSLWYSIQQSFACLLGYQREHSVVCKGLFGICKRLGGLKRQMTLGSCQLHLWLKRLS